MSHPIAISVEKLGKLYKISHQAQRQKQSSLREIVTEKLDRLSRRERGVTRASVEDFWALRDVTFDIKQGEVFGVMGRNGSGKSTLLKILSRITQPTEGRVRIRGRVASLLEVGTGFHGELTGRENIFLNGAILGMSRGEIRAKFDEIVAFARVEKFLDTPVKHYSSGMHVRLAFAVASHLEPEILIIDEVLAVGDAQFQAKCIGKMQDVAQSKGRTVLFVSHSMPAVRSLCTQAMMLSNGQLVEQGDTEKIIQTYLGQDGNHTETAWRRASQALKNPIVYLSSLDSAVSGKQPKLTLTLKATLCCEHSECPKCFIAVDVRDGLGTAIFRTMPFANPVMEFREGTYQAEIEIDLPPMVPGRYSAGFWIGSHHAETLDYVKNTISLTIDESPIPERTFPHSAEHGAIVAYSRCDFRRIGSLEEESVAESAISS